MDMTGHHISLQLLRLGGYNSSGGMGFEARL
jgi:hypothetical protein